MQKDQNRGGNDSLHWRGRANRNSHLIDMIFWLKQDIVYLPRDLDVLRRQIKMILYDQTASLMAKIEKQQQQKKRDHT